MEKRIRLRTDRHGRWIEVRLEPGWTAAYRMGSQNGRSIVTEVRLFPWAERGFPPGEWVGSVEPSAITNVPRGGITSRVIREMRLAEHIRRARPLLQSQAAFDAALGESFGVQVPVSDHLKRPGRKGHPFGFYAQLAAEYVTLTDKADPRVNQTLAARRGETTKRIAAQIQDARRKGYLSPAARGVAGGELTSKAVEELKSVRAQSKGKRVKQPRRKDSR